MTVRRVIVTGHGAAPAMAAVALRRAFGRAGLAVEWVETPGDIPANAVYTALPNLQVLHRLLGIDPAALLQACGGTFTLGQQYLGFSGGEHEFLHSYGPVGRPLQGLPFMQYWLKARASGLPAAFGDFAREGMAARNGRVRLTDGKAGLATAHGYHFDARAYATAMKAHAIQQGVTITTAASVSPVTESGRVTALRLPDGRTLEADWFIDATADAAILSALGDGAPMDTPVSTCDRLMLASAAPFAPLPLYSRVMAHRAGWTGLYPLRNRTGVAIAYDSALLSDDEAGSLAGIPLGTECEIIPLAPFERRRPWIGNVVAIGEASGSAEPLGAPTLHRIQIAVTHLISLLPVSAAAMPEAGIYNEELAGWHARLRDFNALHYALNRREEPFWQAARARGASADLDARISLFGARGMVAQYNQDSFAEDEWQACFLGHGLTPRSWDPQIDRVDEQAIMTDFRDQLMAIRADVTAMDTHEAALGKAMAG